MPQSGNSAKVEHRVVYYLRKFPVLSETFIQREIRALYDIGCQVFIVADEAETLYQLDPEVAELATMTFYITRTTFLRHGNALIYFLMAQPAQLTRVAWKIARSRYSRFKSFREDVRIFLRVIYLAKLARELRVGHIHAPWAGVNAFTALLAAKLCSAHFTLQMRAFELYSPLDKYLLTEKIAGASFVITNTQYNVRTIQELLGPTRKTPIHQVYNGIEVNKFHPHAGSRPAKLPSRERTWRILCVARLVEQKGIEYLLAACHQLKREGLRIECRIVGEPFLSRYAGYHRKLLRLHEQLNLQDCVFFSGAKPFSAVMEYYQWADFFVLPCVIEGSGNRDVIPNVIIEAMAMELPVITTPVAGIPEMITHEIDGLFVEQRDVTALASNIRRLMADPQLTERLGRAARLRAIEQFDIQKNIQKYASLYRSLCPSNLSQLSSREEDPAGATAANVRS